MPVLTDQSAEQFDRLQRERDEIVEQQRATAEILRVIRVSPGNVQPVFETIVQNAVTLQHYCGWLLRLAGLPTYPLDRLSRYEYILWRQARQIMFMLESLRRRKRVSRRAAFPFSIREL
jgi:hypothetical protein